VGGKILAQLIQKCYLFVYIIFYKKLNAANALFPYNFLPDLNFRTKN
jgi:hypothetical protein